MPKVNNAEYWKNRFKVLENSQYVASEEYFKDIQKQFRVATNSIQIDINRWYQRLADNNDISYAAARKLLKRNELEEFQWGVEEYIKHGKENSINKKWLKELENASSKVHISYLDAMKLQVQQHAEKLFSEYEGSTAEFLSKSFEDKYYHTAYEVVKGMGVGTTLHKIDTRKIDILIRQPWGQDGRNFSDRIWANKKKLVNTLHNELSQNVIRETSPQTAINNIARTMRVSQSAAGTLILTENAAITSHATEQCYKDIGLDKYDILATLDKKTSKICQDMDGKAFEMKEYKVGLTAPPFHPRCRTTTIPHFDDDFIQNERRAARDNKTKNTRYVENITFKEWKKKYVKEAGLSANDKQTYQVQEHDSPKFLEKIDFNDKAVVLSKLDEYTKKIALDNEKENAVVILKNGSVIQCFGDKNSVYPDADLNEELRGAYVTHNHPISETSFSFSSPDRELFCDYQLEQLIGVDDKYIYILTKDASDIDEETKTIFELMEMSEQEQRAYASHSMNIQACKKLQIGYRRYERI